MPLADARREVLKSRCRAPVTHDAEARERLAAAAKWHDPGEAAGCHPASEMDFDVFDLREGQLELRAMNQYPRQPEAEQAIESIAGATGDDGRSRPHRPRRGPHFDAIRVAVDGSHPLPGMNRGARGNGLIGEGAIESDAIDDRGSHGVGGDDDRAPVGGDEPRGLGNVEDRGAWKLKLVERVEAE